jgi:hypothetical protein
MPLDERWLIEDENASLLVRRDDVRGTPLTTSDSRQHAER